MKIKKSFYEWKVRAGEQGGKRPGGETDSQLLGQCAMRRRTGTSALSELNTILSVETLLMYFRRKLLKLD